MLWELDHVFLACPDETVAREAFAGSGITLEEGRVHPGQGTRNLCAYFDNAYFEVLLPADGHELRSAIVAPLNLQERITWRETGACPFGVCLRPSESADAP